MNARSGRGPATPRSRLPDWLHGPAGNVLLVLFSVLLTAAVIEFSAWVWVEFLRPKHLTQWEFRATQPPPYRGVDYFNEQFLRESEAVIRGRLTDVLELESFHGRYFNVSHGFRVTTDTPLHPTRRVMMFGGSTLFSQEVPDRYTIPSYLQRMLNEAGVRWQVLNFGLHGMNTAQQTKILRRVGAGEGDIIVFYDGVNDIYYLVFGGFQGGWVHGTPAFRPIQKLSTLDKTLYAWHQRLKDYSYTADVALDIYQRGKPSTITDPVELADNLDVAASQFRAAIVEAAELARRDGAQFVHFLQPEVFENSPMTDYEKSLVANPLLTAPGVETAFKVGYPRLRKVAQDLQKQDIAFFDISKSFNGRPPGEEILLDFCHVNQRGNEIVARQMFDRYFAPLLQREAHPVREAGAQSGASVSK